MHIDMGLYVGAAVCRRLLPHLSTRNSIDLAAAEEGLNKSVCKSKLLNVTEIMFASIQI